MRASYGVATSNDQTAKLFDLPSKYCGAASGTISQCEDVISELYHQMAQTQKTPDAELSPEQVRKCINDSYFQIYTELASEALPFAGIALYRESHFLQDGRRLVKRRQALRERNLPRNSQLETHRFDERGRGPQGLRPHRNDRFPHA
jgi:hypothetical protein